LTPSTLENAAIVELHAGTDVNLHENRFPFNGGLGTHLVARMDCRPLTGDMVNAMIDFCRFHLTPHFRSCAAAASTEDHKMHLLDLAEQLTPGRWSTYFAQWTAEQTDRKERRGECAYTTEKARAGKERMGLTEDDRERLTSLLFNTQAEYLTWYEQKYGGS
jgi:hypothetical protein